MSAGDDPEHLAPSEAAPDDAVVVVVAAIDLSAMASHVVETAARFARRTWSRSQLHLVHVFRSTRFDRRSHAGLKTEDLVAEAQNYLDHYVRAAGRLFPGPVTGHLAQGDPSSEIVEQARSLSADWLLLGTQDTQGIEHFLLGSVAEKVAKSAPCSVVIVRQKRRP